MDYLDPVKKRKHARRLTLGYVLLAVVILTSSLIVLFLTLGYDINRKTGEVIQNGLVFVSSHPNGAQVLLDGKSQGSGEMRLTIPAGKHNLDLRLDGYHGWSRSFDLEGSSVERMSYPILFPEKLGITELQTYAAPPALQLQSPDRRWLLLQQSGTLIFDQLDTNNHMQAVKNIALPDGLLTTAAKPEDDRGLALVEWSSDNRHVLLAHNYDGKQEYIIVDREAPAQSFNVNKTFSDVVFSQVTMRDKRFDSLYLHDKVSQNLYSADVKSRQTKALLSGVLSYKSYKADTILFAIKDPSDPTKMLVQLREAEKTSDISRPTMQEGLLLDMADYDGQKYVAVTAPKTGRMYIYKNPTDQQRQTPSVRPVVAAALNIADATQMGFSANTQFVMARSGNKFAVYDLFKNRRYFYEIKDLSAESPVIWMDGHRLNGLVGGKLSVWDYDGINQQILLDVNAGSRAFFDRDYNRLFTVGVSSAQPGKSALRYTSLRLDQK